VRSTLTSVLVDDQDKALRLYPEVLGFVKKTEIPLGAQLADGRLAGRTPTGSSWCSKAASNSRTTHTSEPRRRTHLVRGRVCAGHRLNGHHDLAVVGRESVPRRWRTIRRKIAESGG